MTIKLGIIGAMQVEIDRLISQLNDDTTRTVATMVFHEGTLGEAATPVVVVRCGVGKVNAAMCTQALIDHFDVTHVLNTGVAGALDPTLDIGDLVVSTDAVHHDMDVTGLGYDPGVVPELDGIAQLVGKLSFVADEQLRALALHAASEVAPRARVMEGRVASGDLFVCETADKDAIVRTFGACCCEMEGTAIAHVCWRNDVPFAILRAISDKADDSSKTEYREQEQGMAYHCGEIALRIAELMGQAQD